MESKQECKDCNKSLDDCTCIEDTIDMKQTAMEKQQQGYSEEEVIKILYQFHYDLVNSNFDSKKEWFEQFKKK